MKFYVPAGMGVSPADQGSDDAADSDGVADGTITIDGVTYTVVKTPVTTIVAGENDMSWDQGLTPVLNSIGDKVFTDSDGDGVQDPGESGVPGVIVVLEQIVDGQRVEIAETVTDSNGGYVFDGLEDGEYCLKFLIDQDWTISPSNAGDDAATDSDGVSDGTLVVDGVTYQVAKTVATTLTGGEIDMTWDQGIIPPVEPASLGDVVWHDRDRDGIQNDAEAGLAGITVNLYRIVDGDRVATASMTTDADGRYLFEGLEPGTYCVEFLIPEVYGISPADQGADDSADSDGVANGTVVIDGDTFVIAKTGNVVLAAGDENMTIDQGVYTNTASLGDYVWIDSNDDGIQNDAETGIAGIEVRLLSVDEDGNRTLPRPQQPTKTGSTF
ncbi:MAG: hypothetical protein H6512_01035 [Acidimicrobiia bacterium]|nr:hypothetical protein [Acidimicrobiia bacterium]